LKLALSAIRSILDVKNSLKLADVLTVSTKNTALNSNNNNQSKEQARMLHTLPVLSL